MGNTYRYLFLRIIYYRSNKIETVPVSKYSW